MSTTNRLDTQPDLPILDAPTFSQKRASPFEPSSNSKRQKYPKTYRVRGIPLDWNKDQLLQFIDEQDGYAGADIKSLARETHGKSQTATVNLHASPHNQKSWSVIMPASPNGQITFDDDFFGLTTLHAPETDHSVDVLAISGLGGHAFGSFKEKGGEHMWLRDSLPVDITTENGEQPMARVLIYGYESNVQDSDNVQDIEDLASTFRRCLVSLVNTPAAKPLILVAHSLGGLIVKQVLLFVSNSTMPDDKKLNQTISSLVFFGVPQAGMDVDALLPMAKDGPNRPLVESINRGSKVLGRQRREFYDYVEAQDWEVFCFYETLMSPTVVQNERGRWARGGEKRYLVSQDSAVDCHRRGTASTHVCAIPCTHSEMVKFSPHDHNYDLVRYQLISLARRAAIRDSGEETSDLRYTSLNYDKPPLSPDERKGLIDLLDFDQIDARIRTVKQPTGSTCRWIRQTKEYKTWCNSTKLVQHHGFWWIRGKPGAGKSVLMKYLFRSRTSIRDAKVVSFFFNARGEELERTTLGLYRSLLSQIFRIFPSLEDALDTLESHTIRAIQQEGWEISSLKDIFLEAVQRLESTPLICYIDALDECPEEEIRNMVRFFEQVGETAVNRGIHLYICFSSRHYPHITIKRGLNMVLEKQNSHEHDIEQFIDAELRIDDPKHAAEVKSSVMKKASGVFLWVVLVIPMLNKEFDRGKIKALKQRLNELPPKLSDLFQDILTRDAADKNALLCCIQWVLFARSPLDSATLYLAVGTSVDDLPFRWDEEASPEIMRRYITNASKGLVEQTVSKTTTMQFIHESVRDFLLKERGFQKLWPELGPHFEAKSHQFLAQCCTKQIKDDALESAIKDLPEDKDSREQARLQTTSLFPLWEYAVNNALYHANEAQFHGEQQKDFLAQFPKQPWIRSWNVLEKAKRRHYLPDISLLYILAELDLEHLVRISPDRMCHLELRGGRYGWPLIAALACGSKKVARDLGLQFFLDQGVVIPNQVNLVSYFASLKPRRIFSPENRSLQSCLASFECVPTMTSLALQGTDPLDGCDGHQMLRSAASSENLELLKFLLDRGFNGENLDESGRGETPLLSGATFPKLLPKVIVQHLIDKGANIEARDRRGCTPLFLLAEARAVSIPRTATFVRQLLEAEADIEATNLEGCTPLFAAAAAGKVDVVQQLINRGAKTDVRDKRGRTILIAAAENHPDSGAPEIFSLLVDRGLDIEARDKDSRTALLTAARYGATKTINELINQGADIEANDEKGRTPLLLALERGFPYIVLATAKQLIERGANIEAKDRDGRTPLMMVTDRASRKVMEEYFSDLVDIAGFLVERGANIEAADKDGNTPLSVAKKSNSSSAERFREIFQTRLRSISENYHIRDIIETKGD